MSKLEKAKTKLWIKVYVSNINQGTLNRIAETCANIAVSDF